MPFDWRRLLGGGGGQQPGNPAMDTSGMNPYQAQVQRSLNQPSQGNRLMGAGLAGLGASQGQPPPPNPGFMPYQGLQGLGQPVQFGQRPPMAPPPASPPPTGMGGPNLGSNMPPGPAMNLGGMSGNPGSTRPIDPNDPYNLNARNRMLGRF